MEKGYAEEALYKKLITSLAGEGRVHQLIHYPSLNVFSVQDPPVAVLFNYGPWQGDLNHELDSRENPVVVIGREEDIQELERLALARSAPDTCLA